MRKVFPTILTIFFLLILSFVFFAREGGAPTPNLDDPMPTSVQDLLGVMTRIDAEAGLLELQSPDGGIVEVKYEGQPVSAQDIGLLIEIDGERDPATRRIFASSVEIADAPNLVVTSPSENATVTSPLVVFGFGRVFEQTFEWRIRDANGEEVAKGFSVTAADDIGRFGPFRFEIFLPALIDPNFTLEVFERSPRDGSNKDLVSIPLTLLSTDTVSFEVFFGNTAEGSLRDCRIVSPVTRRVAKTSAVGRAALLELIKGPTSEERAAGFITQLPRFTDLNTLSINEGIARADFTSPMKTIGGRCQTEAVRAQIVNTLTQFSSIEDVEIASQGEILKNLE